MDLKNNIFKMAVLPKVICMFSKIPITIPVTFSGEIGIPMLKVIKNLKESWIGKMILNMKTKLEDSHFPFSKVITEPQ